MSVESWNSLFQVGSLALVLATFALGAGALWTGNRINKRQTDRLLVLESDLTKARERTANAETVAAEAKAVSAKAGEGTLKALADVAVATERAGRIEVEAAAQRERAAIAEKSLLELKNKLKPRTLTAVQIGKLVAGLKGAQHKGHVQVGCIGGDTESCTLAWQLHEAIKSAGWSTDFTHLLGVSARGIAIGVKNVEMAPLYALSLHTAMKAAGMEADGVSMTDLPDNLPVRLVIGSKPE